MTETFTEATCDLCEAKGAVVFVPVGDSKAVFYHATAYHNLGAVVDWSQMSPNLSDDAAIWAAENLTITNRRL